MSQLSTGFESQTCNILDNVEIADSTYRLRFESSTLASRLLPGQFFIVRISDSNDPLIGRALAMFDCNREAGWVDVVYVVKGKFTQQLCRLAPNQSVSVWGPLGNTFPITPVDHLVLVSGGVGQTPMLTVAKEALGNAEFGSETEEADGEKQRGGFAGRVSLCYGARHKGLLAGLSQFEQACTDLHITTDDGSAGKKGLVTNSLLELFHNSDGRSMRVYCCGPEPMMQAVSELCGEHKIECYVSLETPMACGIGICFTCVAQVCVEDDPERKKGDNPEWDYRRTCVDGPIFKADQIVW